MGEKYIQIMYLMKVYYPEYIKNTYISTIKRQITQLKNGQRTETNISPKKTYKWKNKHMKRCLVNANQMHKSTSLGKCKPKPQ